jgi:hypothetical protein
MKILHAVMRFYSYLFTLGPAAFLTGMGAVAYISGQHNWKIDTLPWTGQDLSTAFLVFGLLGLLAVPLAALNWFRWLMPLVAFVYALGIVYVFFWQNYRFADLEEFQGVVSMAIGAVGSFLSSLMEFKRYPTKPRK